MKYNYEEAMAVLRSLIGDRDDEEILSIIENFDETLSNVNDEVEWERKYNELDEQWRKRYRDRFFSGKPEEPEEPKEPEEPEKEVSFEDLFE